MMLIGLLLFTACQTGEDETHMPLTIEELPPPTGEEAPDDIVPTPGGYAYRANVHQQGVENPWPPIESAKIVLGSGSDALDISYRDYIETEAGETRNNIIHVGKEGGLFNSQLTLYSVAVPAGIGLTDGGRGVGLPGATGAVLVIEVDPDVTPGQYAFEIGIELDGKDYGTISCAVEVIEIFRSDELYLEVQLPPGWAAVEGPEGFLESFHGQVAFNSWGQEDFWAREVLIEKTADHETYRYSTQTVMDQIPKGGAYVALVSISGPQAVAHSISPPPEYALNDLSGLWQPHDCREDAESGAQFMEFYKWGRDLRLEVACHCKASDETVAELNDLLQSWRFDSVPAGDIEWAGLQARQLLPEEVEPLKFSIRPGRRGDEGIGRITEAEVQGDTVHFKFMYRWNIAPGTHKITNDCPDDSCHWWEIDVLPSGEAVLTDEGGAQLP